MYFRNRKILSRSLFRMPNPTYHCLGISTPATHLVVSPQFASSRFLHRYRRRLFNPLSEVSTPCRHEVHLSTPLLHRCHSTPPLSPPPSPGSLGHFPPPVVPLACRAVVGCAGCGGMSGGGERIVGVRVEYIQRSKGTQLGVQ